MKWWSRLVRRANPDQDLEDEIRFHLEEEVRLRRERGESIEGATERATRDFGNVLLIKETTRDMWGRRLVGEFAGDVRFGLRMMARTPVLAVAAIASLALGIGANTAIFTVVNAVVLRPLPYPEPQRLIAITQRHPQFGLEFTTLPDFQDWRDRATTLSAIGGAWGAAFNMSGGDEPERLSGAFVTPGFFDAFNIPPAIGSTIANRPEDDRYVVVLGHDLWRRRFNAAADVVGRRVELNNRPYAIAGVMPPGFAWPAATQLWLPLVPEDSMNRGYHMLQVVARLRAEATITQADAELSAIAAAASSEHPATNKDWGVQTESLLNATVSRTARSLWILDGAAACLLLIACANVASLLASRAVSRRLEMALRSALGASRHRLLRQLLTESLVLSVCAGAAGLALAAVAIDPLLRLTALPRSGEVSLDWRVFAVTVAASVVTAGVVGLLSAWHASRADLREVQTTRVSARTGWLRPSLLIVEVAAAVVLLVGSGLLIRSFYRLQQVEVGFDAEHLLTMRFFLPRAGYPQERAVQLYEQMIERVEAVPGVRSAAAVSAFPLAGATPNVVFSIPALPPPAPGQAPSADFASITPGYFQAMGIPLIAGRQFEAADGAAAPFVAIVTQSMANKFFPGEDAIGQTIRILSQKPRTIVGIVAETRQRTLDAAPAPHIYLPHAQQPLGGMFLVVRAVSDRPERLAPDVRERIRSLDASLPIASIQTADQLMGGTLSARRFTLVLLTLFSATALALAIVGVYGVLSFTVSQRQSEIGIRMALGAAQARVLTLIMWQGMWPAIVGLAIGIAAAAASSRVLSSTLFEIGPRDPMTIAGVSALLFFTAIAAAFLPARRASRIDPRIALQ